MSSSKNRRATVCYAAAHARVKRDRGRAASLRCVDCGRSADEWSYDGRDPLELESEFGKYSLSPSHYEPRCTSCHRRKDSASRPRSETCSRGHFQDQATQRVSARPDGRTVRACRKCQAENSARYKQRKMQAQLGGGA